MTRAAVPQQRGQHPRTCGDWGDPFGDEGMGPDRDRAKLNRALLRRLSIALMPL